MVEVSDPQIGAASLRNTAFESTFTRGRVISERVGTEQARVIIDVGAFTGETAEWFCDIFPNAKVLAIEPFPESFALLQTRAQVNNRIKPFRFAATDFNGTVQLNSNSITHTNGIYPINPTSSDSIAVADSKFGEKVAHILNEQITVKAQTLSSFAQDHEISGVIDLLKIDVQGAEIDVLKGSQSILHRVRCVLIEISLYDYYVRSSSIGEVEAILDPYGFSLWSITDISRNPMNGRTDWVELLYIKRDEAS